MSKPQKIAVFGATGAQGGGVAAALQRDDAFLVRALTRKPDSFTGEADEVVRADLDGAPDDLAEALRDVHGVFLVTNFWATGTDEVGQANRAIHAARQAGVQHLVWSTLPDVARISGGRFQVPHFTNKARVNATVAEAGFPCFTFIEAPFYYQNLVGQMAPSDLGDGRKGWALPIDPNAEVVHMGDISELGLVVLGAFKQLELVGAGQTLSVAGDRQSFAGIVETLNTLGHDLTFREVPPSVFSGFFPGAAEMADMMRYWQEFTYFGPKADEKVALARRVAGRELTDFATWAARNMPAGAAS